MKPKRAIPFSPQMKDKIYAVRAEIVERCSVCKGTGYVPAGDRAVYRCDCMVLFRYVKELVKADIPEEYWKLSLGELKVVPAAKQFAKFYTKNIKNAKQKGLGVVFFGPNGIGKTSIMCAIGKEAIVHGYDVRYFTLATYINALFAKDTAAVEQMEYGDFLLIDELDKRGGNITSAVDEFLRRMSNDGRALVISTNWDLSGIKENLGESIYSLLNRKCEFVPMEGVDISMEINSAYLDRLEGTFNYAHENIKSMALRREELNG